MEAERELQRARERHSDELRRVEESQESAGEEALASARAEAGRARKEAADASQRAAALEQELLGHKERTSDL